MENFVIAPKNNWFFISYFVVMTLCLLTYVHRWYRDNKDRLADGRKVIPFLVYYLDKRWYSANEFEKGCFVFIWSVVAINIFRVICTIFYR